MSKTAPSKRSAQGQALYEGLETLPSSKRFTRDQLEVIYAMAYAHLVQAQYAQALPIMAFLAQYGPTRRHYLYGLALSLQMLNRVDEAIGIYSLCALLFPGCIESAQRIAQCHVSAGRSAEACETLTQLMIDARTAGDLELARKVQGMLDHIRKPAVERQ